MPALYIGSYDVIFGINTSEKHSFIYYNSGISGENPLIIRGGSDENYAEHGVVDDSIIVELYNNAKDSYDNKSGLSTWGSLNYNLIAEGSYAASLWSAMLNFAETLGSSGVLPAGLYDTGIKYSFPGPNSNSITNSILNAVGLDFRYFVQNNIDGSPTFVFPYRFPGHMSIIDGYGSSTFTAYRDPNAINSVNIFYKAGGDDSILLKDDVKLIIEYGNKSTGLTSIYAQSINFNQTIFTTIGSDLIIKYSSDKSIIVEINGYYAADGGENINGALSDFYFNDFYYRFGGMSDDIFDASAVSQAVRLEGRGGGDMLTGSYFGDSLFGADGDDGDGNDVIYAGAGDDLIRGGLGQDQFYGEDGVDTYVFEAEDSSFAAYDVILDFVSGSDKLDLSALYRPTLRLSTTTDGVSTYLYADLEGDGTWDFVDEPAGVGTHQEAGMEAPGQEPVAK